MTSEILEAGKTVVSATGLADIMQYTQAGRLLTFIWDVLVSNLGGYVKDFRASYSHLQGIYALWTS
jgi:hypothetical protein